MESKLSKQAIYKESSPQEESLVQIRPEKKPSHFTHMDLFRTSN
jgi:hypothetical protein